MVLLCNICNNSIKQPPSRIKSGRGKYCSKQCYYKSRKGKRVSIISEFKKGHLLGKRIQKGQHLSFKTEFKATKGKPHCVDCKKSLRNYHAKRCKHCNNLGEKSPFWKGGVSLKNKTARQIFMTTLEYKNWRKQVFERDNYSCIVCKYKGKSLHADHIKPYALYPELRLNIDNGRTLCKSCHMKTDTWGNKIYNYL